MLHHSHYNIHHTLSHRHKLKHVQSGIMQICEEVSPITIHLSHQGSEPALAQLAQLPDYEHKQIAAH